MSALTVRIRAAGPDEAAAIAALHSESWRSAYRGILPDALLDGPLELERARHWRDVLAGVMADDAILVAEQRAALVGFIAVFAKGEPGFGAVIDNLHVRPALKGGGIGRRLLGAAAERFAAAGTTALHLWVYDANRPTLAFYEKLGGVVEERGLERNGDLEIPHSRVVWRDLAALAARCRAKS
ncbi:MAG: GNAT family N-acetyltransferase [Kiloniellales bacterium]